MRNKGPFKLNPDERIKMIHYSLRCLGFGTASAAMVLAVPVAIVLIVNMPASYRDGGVVVMSWIPLLSFTFSLLAWTNLFRAKSAAQGEWNPAARQLVWGRILSAFGILVSTLIATFYIGVLLKFFPWQD